MNVLIIMAHVPMTVSIQRVVIIVSALLDTSFNLTSMIAKVNICTYVVDSTFNCSSGYQTSVVIEY